ncbi:hypothetical protein Q5O14_00480 [Eubacteriaceae bacterium ES2]|nr:hypothetical protein Q5O14_00480 [Eubacteriaceae bacterium ES2]
MNQNNLRKLASASCMTLAMIGLFSTSVLAADAQYQKNENVYISLDAEGEENGFMSSIPLMLTAMVKSGIMVITRKF